VRDCDFYYFDPTASGCSLVEGVDVITAHYAIESSLGAPTTYPEFDRLVEDRLVTMVAFFGQIKHGALIPEDPGWSALAEWNFVLVRQGFKQVETFPNRTGARWEKVHASGLRIVVTNYSPEALSGDRDRSEVAILFKEEIAKNEIVYYAGHSFYGSLDVLQETGMYPKEIYQIFFMDSCWSYAYYTRQVFIGKASTEDPTGMVNADVINNTEPGMTSADPPGLRFFAPLFEGAAAVASGAQPTRYSWNKVVAYVNAAAELRAKHLTAQNGREFSAEIYGVSGARNNAYRPITADSKGTRYEQLEPVAIVDNDPVGLTSTIEVPDSGSIASVFVDVDIEHPWNADLVVKLSHVDPHGQGTREVVLFNRFDDTESDTDLHFKELELAEFNELDMRGPWKLSVADVGMGDDAGELRRWALRIVPRP
jgi:subtilisin-like proprotein convertase family protein